ncbi:MAG: integrase arm-type DNA-binding domain-containing protein [Rhodoferax sp.]|jgi:integrase|nr:integrase arm-type DNA-binding domain-containing protein [Rhodoferax sp.]
MPTQAEISKLQPGTALRKIALGEGLQLDLTPAGRKLWRYRYRLNGKDSRIALGAFPAISLKQARELAFKAARQVADGIDPAMAKRQRRLGTATGVTFKQAWDSWLADFLKSKPANATIKKLASQSKALSPLMALTLPAITPAVIRDLLRDIQDKGHVETAHRLKWRISDVFGHAIDVGLFTGVNPIAGLGKKALVPLTTTPRAAITDPLRLSQMLKATDGYAGQPETVCALKLLPMLMARPGELRAMEWLELDLDAAEPLWRIPAVKMKMGLEHLVPLPKQAVSLLEAIRPYSSHSRYCFPNLRSANQPLSDNALNAALRAMGFGQAEVCAHGFRSTASTLLNEQGVAPDLIELQLAHVDKSVRAVYNRAKRLADRRTMLQGWADYLDTLR